MKRKRILCDLDGTVAGWKNVPIEVYSKEGYYSSLDPVINVIESIKKLCEDERFEVYIASAVLNDNHSIKDKNLWIDNYMPFIDIEHRVFIPYGTSKVSYLKEKNLLTKGSVLIDDLSLNLFEWEKEFPELKLVGVKVMNGINGTKGTWKGFKVHFDSLPDVIYKTIVAATT